VKGAATKAKEPAGRQRYERRENPKRKQQIPSPVVLRRNDGAPATATAKAKGKMAPVKGAATKANRSSTPIDGRLRCAPALNFSTDVELFSVSSGWSGASSEFRDRIRHIPNGMIFAPVGWTFGSRFAYDDVGAALGQPGKTARGRNLAKGRNRYDKRKERQESDQEPEGQETRSGENVDHWRVESRKELSLNQKENIEGLVPTGTSLFDARLLRQRAIVAPRFEPLGSKKSRQDAGVTRSAGNHSVSCCSLP
jgi:hypothetical protein